MLSQDFVTLISFLQLRHYSQPLELKYVKSAHNKLKVVRFSTVHTLITTKF